MITFHGTVDNRFLGLTLKGCGRKLFLRASLISTICEAMDIPDKVGGPKVFKHTFVTLATMPDDNFEVTNRAEEILEHL